MFKHICRNCKKEYENDTLASRKCVPCTIPKGKYYQDHKANLIAKSIKYAIKNKKKIKKTRNKRNDKKYKLKEKMKHHQYLINEGKKINRYVIYRGRMIRIDGPTKKQEYEEHMSHD